MVNANAYCRRAASDAIMTRLTRNAINQDVGECDLVGLAKFQFESDKAPRKLKRLMHTNGLPNHIRV